MNTIALSVTELSNDPKNARKHNELNIISIMNSLVRFGQQKPIVISKDRVVYAGNGTLEAARRLGWTMINCVESRLSIEELKAYAIADNRTSELAEWDEEALKLNLLDLKEYEDRLPDTDSNISLLDATGFSLDEIDSYLRVGSSDKEKESLYTKKIQAPIYEPKGDKPSVEELLDLTKANSMIGKINRSNLSDQDKAFLRFAAYRHIVFSYDKIAEYYAHASKELQEFMEESALVIIDFNKAIENGFVRMSEQIAEAFKDEE